MLRYEIGRVDCCREHGRDAGSEAFSATAPGPMGVVTLADALPYRVDDLTGVPIDVLGVGVDDPGGGIAALAGRVTASRRTTAVRRSWAPAATNRRRRTCSAEGTSAWARFSAGDVELTG